MDPVTIIALVFFSWLLYVCFGQRMHHLSVYRTTSAGAVTDQDAPAIQDPAVTLVNGHPIFPVPIQLYMGYAFGDADLSSVAFTTPKLRAINVVRFMPLDVSATITSRPPMVEFFHHPLSLNPIDENQVLVSGGAALTQAVVAVWFGDGVWNVPQGDMFTIRGTASITTVANAWATAALTLDSPLPAGRYAVVGAHAFGANGQFFNIVFPNQVWRPGSQCYADVTGIGSRYTRWGNLGVWGEFESALLPQLSVQASAAATTTYTVFLDIVRVR